MAEGPENAAEQQKELSATKDEESKSPAALENGEDDEEPLQNVFELDHHPDCPVCLQPASYPVKLPCGHIFCFLCIKGVALRSRKCAICRQVIAVDYLESPTLVKVVSLESTSVAKSASECEDLEYVWFYEGRNGWWQYDNKTSKEVELSFKSGKRSCTLLIAGFLYLIDFENMFQMRRNEPGRRRRIKRDKPNVDRKGVAGIRLQGLTITTEADAASQPAKPDGPSVTRDAEDNHVTGTTEQGSASEHSSAEAMNTADNRSDAKESSAPESTADDISDRKSTENDN